MSRKKAREIALHLIFEMSFQERTAEELLEAQLDEEIMHSIAGDIALYAGKLTDSESDYIISTVKGVAAHREELDTTIAEYARGWSMKRLSKMTTALLRLALYEMRYVEDVPIGAAINEAVELAKTYESEEAGAFINGILGTIGRAESAPEQ